jgi:hypothetical protein
MRNLLVRIGFAALVVLPIQAQAQSGDAPSTPNRNPFRAKASTVEAPATKPVAPADQQTVTWSDDAIAAAKLECAKVLSGMTLEYQQLPPLKEGSCGAPAPILVKSIGGVAIEPAATMTCALARGLNVWISKTLQPQAEAILGTRAVKLHNATSYSCRNRYGGENTPLSEHALANALDISEFVFESGQKLTVLASWPRVVTVPPAPLPNPARIDAETTGSIGTAELTKAKVTARTNPFVVPSAVAKPTPAPAKPAAEVAPPEAQSQAELKGAFVKSVHDDACQTFGTVLGPEANDAHKDHFHFDMKARRHKAICE